jgi:hypothetical protein
MSVGLPEALEPESSVFLPIHIPLKSFVRKETRMRNGVIWI